MEVAQIAVEFAVLSAVIGFAGYFLCRYGDAIAEKTGLGRTWVGLAMLATVTSLPELVTGITAVTIGNAPNIALGDALGSCVFNLTLIVILDFLHRKASVYTVASQGHILSAAFCVVLLGFLVFNLLLAHNGLQPAIGHVGAFTPIALVLYLVAMKTVFRYERMQREPHVGEIAERYPDISLGRAMAHYVLHSALVVSAAMRLPFTAQHLALAMGWHNSFVGTSFVAFTTSLPEVVVTLAALRIGALDMAIADLFGSNLFDLAIVALDDLAYTAGPRHFRPVGHHDDRRGHCRPAIPA